MRGWLVRVAILLILPITASANTPPSVLTATIGTDGSAISRFTLRFSEPMVPLGKGDAPMSMECVVPGEGRWTDTETFVWEFEKPLPGNTTCTAELKPGLKTSAGRALTGTRSFPIDSGGPFARAVLPREGNSGIEEDQTFFVATNGPVSRASIASGAYCSVDGIGERIPVDLLPADTAGRILSQLTETWQVEGFLEEAGQPGELPDTPELRRAALANVVALKCRRPLPPGRDMALVWGGTIKSPTGRAAGEDHRFDYTVRDAFSARLTCGRVNADAGCDPIERIKVNFTASVPRAQALAARLDVGGGKMLAPVDEGNESTLDSITFEPPMPPAIKAKLILPADLRDESGRPLSNARRFPLEFEIASTPPLVKFAAPFGILEAKQGGVLPVTVRGVEPSLVHSVNEISGGAQRIAADDGKIADWIRRVAKHQQDDIRNEEPDSEKEPRFVNHTGDTPLLGDESSVKHMNLALPGKGKEFEVVGLPLSKPGFYVVELASPGLGAALMGRQATRYVSAAALVTDMAVHFKWGRAASLAWVTSLDGGKPVEGAEIRVTDSCTGRQLATGTTDKYGRLLIRDGLPTPTSSSDCENIGESSPPLMVSATKGDDFSFTLTSWGDGIQPYNFELNYGWSEASPIFHSIFDRTLLRAGETVHMKHVYRKPIPMGFATGGAISGTLVLQHRGSETSFELPLKLDAGGIGENEWTPPKGAPMGDYDITIRLDDGPGSGGPDRAATEDAAGPTADTIYTGQSIRVDEYRLPTMRATVAGPRTRQVKPSKIPVDLYVGYLSGGGSAGAPVRLRTAWNDYYDRPDGWDKWTFGGEAVREGTEQADYDESAATGDEPPEAATIPLTLDSGGALRTDLDVPALTRNASLTVEMDYQDANGETLTASTAIPVFASAVQLGIRPVGWTQRDTNLRLQLAALDLDDKVIAGQHVDVELFTRETLSSRRRLIGGFYAYDNVVKTKKIAGTCSVATDSHGLADCQLSPNVSGEVIAVAKTRDKDGNETLAVTSVYLAGSDEWWFGGDNGDRMDIVPDATAYHAGDTARIQVRMPFRKATALVTVEREGVLSSFVTQLSGKDPTVAVKLDGAYAPDVFISVMAVRGRVSNWRVWLAELAETLHMPMLAQKIENPTALVDLAKPAYRIGMTKVKVGWEGHQLRVAMKADRDAYHVREQAHVAVQVRGPDGRAPQSAEIAFAAVDEALLNLSPNDSWNLLDAMMGERPISVLTSTAAMQVVGKRHYGRKAVPAGGGGGGDLSALTRTDFRPVLLWRGRVQLDGDGRAVIDVPMADSLSSYKLVAVATAGENLFGTGQIAVRTVQDLTIYAGLPPLVRSGDEYGATFTLKNGTQKPMNVTASVAVQPGAAFSGAPQTLTVPAGGAVPVTWRITAPENIDKLTWTVSAQTADGKAVDRLSVDEQVAPAIPVETWAATFLRVGGAPFQVAPPAGALPGRGSVDVAFTASPAPAMTGVRAYMLAYPYGCFEQRLSKAVALEDEALWAKQMNDLPTYMASDGLLRYWPDQGSRGSIALTAYALSITAEAGMKWPDGPKAKLLDAMRAVVDGRLVEEYEGPADMRMLRIAALGALARNGAATPAMIGQTAIPVGDMPTAMLADWMVTLDKIRGVDAKRKAAVEAALRGRIVYEGTRLDLVDKGRAPWWMMVSNDEMAIKALIAVTGRPGWRSDAPRMMIGIALRQYHGHWDTTPSNAWGTLAVKRFATAYPGAATGISYAQLGSQRIARNWPNPPLASLPLPAAPMNLLLTHSASPGPWATVSVRAAVPLTAPAFAGYRVSRQVTFLQRKAPDRISAGDVLKVRLTVDAPVDRTWVVVDDPIPAGASIVSGGGGQSMLLAGRASSSGWWPSYIERGLDSWRAYYGWLPKGRTSVEYVLRINGSGRFLLPPTRVEAMYSPEIHAALPNQPMVVTQ